MKEQIIFATGNQNKLKEIRMILGDRCEVLSMKEAGIDADIVENGITFEDNAIIKAQTIAKLSGKMALADDSGLVVDAMDGMPGIYSSRFMGEDTSYDIKNAAIIEKLEGLTGDERSARFVCAIAAAWPDGTLITCRGIMEGRIAFESAGSNGFGYDPIFYLPEFGCTSAELSPEDKNKISHRGKAMRLMGRLLAAAEKSV